MKLMRMVLLIFGVPIIAAWIAVQVAPYKFRVYVAIFVYFMTTFLAIALEVERNNGTLTTFKDVATASRFGLYAYAWWVVIMLSIIGVAWLSSIMI